MKSLQFRFFTLTMLMMALLCGVSHGAPVRSDIDAVTLYTSGALITRTARLQLSAGEQNIKITGFPAKLDARSVRVKIDNANVSVGQVSTEEINFARAQDPEVLKLEEQVLAIDKKIRRQQDRAKSAQLQMKFLDSLAEGYGKQAWTGSVQGRADTASWQSALSLMQSGSSEALEKLRDSEEEQLELQQQRNALVASLNSKKSDARASTSVLVALNSPAAVSTLATIQYQQQDAGWNPAYEARLDTSSGRLVLSQKAVVEQYTDEEWPNVKLTLSTSRPSDAVQAPVVTSQFYRLSSPAPRPTAAPISRSASADIYLEEVVVSGVRRTAGWSGQYALSFPVAGRVKVSNDSDQSQRFDLQSFEFDSELVTQVSPAQAQEAFLAARLPHDGSVPLYGSDMQVFVDGIFSGEASMPAILPGKEITLPMGQDPRIEVRVVDLGARDAERGIIKKVNTQSQDLVYEITNRRPAAAEIEVRAAFPVSKHKSVKVDIGKQTTEPTEQNTDEQTGVALWRKQVKPNETWKIRYQVTISYPSDRQLEQSYR